MKAMFYNCNSLTTINLTNFYSLNSTDMSYTFFNCSSLVNITFSKNSLYLKEVKYMFYNFTNLKSLDLQNFDTSNVTNINSMFEGCYNLKQ